MQNKGFIKIISVLLILVCLFYLSFSAVVRYYDNKAKQIANGDAAVEQAYLDSLANEKVCFGNSRSCLTTRPMLRSMKH